MLLPGVSHFAPVQRPELFNAAVLGFLARFCRTDPPAKRQGRFGDCATPPWTGSFHAKLAAEDKPMKFDSILGTVGNTPVVRINKLGPKGINLYVKVEAFNPLGSVKDRLALGVIEAAENAPAS